MYIANIIEFLQSVTNIYKREGYYIFKSHIYQVVTVYNTIIILLLIPFFIVVTVLVTAIFRNGAIEPCK